MDEQIIIYIVIGVLSVAIIGVSLAYVFKKDDSFLNNLEWRRAVKHFSPGPVDYKPIENAIINAPSSFGLQPYKVVIVTDQELKIQMRPLCFNQEQVETSHVVFILCGLRDVESRMEQFLLETKAEPYRGLIKGFLDSCPDKLAWAQKQAYIALGFGLAAAAEKKIYSCPMEGFIADKVSELLKLDSNLVPSVMLAVGLPGDNVDISPRFRFPSSDLVIYL
jgi:nitroreductase